MSGPSFAAVSGAAPGSRDAAAARRDDEAARELVQSEFDRPLVLEAGAGTGKTTVLVGRIAGWCLGPGWERASTELRASRTGEIGSEEVAARVLRGVVAITFTEAAAAEMASRVAELLRDVLAGAPPTSFASRALPASAAERALRARALLGGLDALSVCTIHAWCHRILREHPLQAGVHPYFQVDASETRFAGVVREVMEAKLAAALREPGDPDFVALAVEVGPPLVEQALGVLVREAIPPEALAGSPLTPVRIRAFCEGLARRTLEVRELGTDALVGSRRATGSAAAAQAIAESPVLLGAATETRDELARVLERLGERWTAPALARLDDWARGKLNQTEEEVLGARVPELAPRARSLRRALDHALGLDLHLLELARRVLHPLLAEATRALRERGVETYTALLRDARDLAVRHPEVAARLRRRIDQLLVDEFQDTDQIQCDLLAEIALAGPREERPVLFLVGDPKQSIYGWRNADLRAYDRFVRRIEAEAGEARRRLVVNFRSVPAILAEVDGVIAPVMREEEGLQPRYERLHACEERRGRGGFSARGFAPVEHWVTWTRDADGAWQTPRVADAAELEARALARNLLDLARDHGVAWRDVALLFRSTGDFDVYLDALRDAGIPYVVERDRSYYRRREIIDAQALLRCILDPNDHLALVTWLRSPAVGVPDAALVPLWREDFPTLVGSLHGGDDALLERLRGIAERAAATLSDEIPGIGRVRGWDNSLVAALDGLARARAWFESEPPDVFAERLRRLLAFEATESARHLGAYRIANLDRLLRTLALALEASGGDVAALLAELRGAVAEAREEEEGRPRDATENAVHVLTIHKAKGLDFRHVYLLQHHKEGGRGAETEPADVALLEDGAEYWLLQPSAATLGWSDRVLGRDQVADAERVRTLYVAMTRAKDRLVLSGIWPTPGSSARRTHAALLLSRDPAPPDLAALAPRLASGAGDIDEAGARWVFPALAVGEEDESEARGRTAAGLPSATDVERESGCLLATRELARARESRPFAAVASASAEKAEDDELLARRYGDASEERREAVAPELARAVGTAVHRALELLDPTLDAEDALRACGERARGALSLLVGPDELETALAGAREVLERFVFGPLFTRLRELAPHVVARELPVLLSPERPDAGPVGFVAGAIDLVHRDPATGELVVVDYKTDRVETDAEIAERAKAYAAQGAEYQRALREALGLDAPPRFELWFLYAGQREVVVPR